MSGSCASRNRSLVAHLCQRAMQVVQSFESAAAPGLARPQRKLIRKSGDPEAMPVFFRAHRIVFQDRDAGTFERPARHRRAQPGFLRRKGPPTSRDCQGLTTRRAAPSVQTRPAPIRRNPPSPKPGVCRLHSRQAGQSDPGCRLFARSESDLIRSGVIHGRQAWISARATTRSRNPAGRLAASKNSALHASTTSAQGQPHKR